jgi:hypothetical protein
MLMDRVNFSQDLKTLARYKCVEDRFQYPQRS